jgi:hypothetical protein
MKNKLKIIDYLQTFFGIALVIIALLFFSVAIPFKIESDLEQYLNQKIDSLEIRIEYLENILNTADSISLDKEWFLKTVSLIIVESSLNPQAVNKHTKASGLLQIMPIYIKEANRLQDNIIFTQQDVFDIDKSIQMYKVINDKHNPEKSMETLVKLHNPKAGQWYFNKVLDTYNILKQISLQLL